MKQMNNLHVFVSYSWDSEEHKEKVKAFVLCLRSKGINVIYDGDLEPGDRLQGFMESSIATSDIILYICTPNYKYKADNRLSGVGYENNIITGELFETHNERKFIPILFAGTWKDSLPTWSKGKVGIDLSNPSSCSSEYIRLLKTLQKQNVQNKRERVSSAPVSTIHKRKKGRKRAVIRKYRKHLPIIIFLLSILFFCGILLYKSIRTNRIKTAYIDFLFSSADYQKESYAVNYINFAFGFIDDDDIPELFLCQDTGHVSGIFIYSYNYKQDKVYCLGELSSFGNLQYYEKQNMIVSQYGGMGFWYHVYEQIQEDGTLKTIAISGIDGSSENFRYYWAYPYLQSDGWIFENYEKYGISEEKFIEREEEFLSEYHDKITIDYDDMSEISRANVCDVLDEILGAI